MSVYTSVIRDKQEWVYILVWSELNKNECIYQCYQSWTRLSVYTSVIRVEQDWFYIPVWSELENECIYQCDQSWTRMSVSTSVIRVEQCDRMRCISVIRVEQDWLYIPVWSELNKNECIYQCDQSWTRNECIYQCDQSWTRMSVYTSVIRVEQEWVYIPVRSKLNNNECIYQCVRVEQEWVCKRWKIQE